MITVGNLGIREYRVSDRENLVQNGNNPKVARWITDLFPSPYSVEDADNWITHCSEQSLKSDFAITLDDNVIGGIGCYTLQNEHRLVGEVGYWLGENYWGEGILTELLPHFVQWLFENRKLERIEAAVFAPNSGSARVLEKSGFTFEGTLRSRVVKNGELFDTKSYSILKNEVLL